MLKRAMQYSIKDIQAISECMLNTIKILVFIQEEVQVSYCTV